MFELTPFVGRNEIARFFDDDMFPFRHGDMRMFRTDVIDNGDSFTLEAELPGFDKKEISVKVKDGVLSINAEHSDEKKEEDEKKGYIYRERSYGTYARSFDISGIDEDKISADYKDGILKVTLPKKVEKEDEGKSITLE
ncbi:MAG: Hsp20/alpha crystallin family protein [Oscillospiraceae bacterium]|jgi:HSP20 family protein